MFRTLLALIMLGLTACQNSMTVKHEEEIVSSIRYDGIGCAELALQRDRLAAQHGLAKNVERQERGEAAAPGLGILIPDMRSKAEQEKGKAIGEITAINQSMERRRCGRPPS